MFYCTFVTDGRRLTSPVCEIKHGQLTQFLTSEPSLPGRAGFFESHYRCKKA